MKTTLTSVWPHLKETGNKLFKIASMFKDFVGGSGYKKNTPVLITTWQIMIDITFRNCSVGPIGRGNYQNSNNPTRLIDSTLYTTVAYRP